MHRLALLALLALVVAALYLASEPDSFWQQLPWPHPPYEEPSLTDRTAS